MTRKIALGVCVSGLLLASTVLAVSGSFGETYPPVEVAESGKSANELSLRPDDVAEGALDVQVIVNGMPLQEYFARGKRYIEALEGAEYEISIRNGLPMRVAVALSVDGLNSIDAKHTTAWNSSKWVIAPYQTIRIGGWQMSSERARRFYFTTERDSYAAKLGQTANLGVISVVAFRERGRMVIPVTPRPGPVYRDDRMREEGESPAKMKAPSSAAGNESMGSSRRTQPLPAPDQESAATGIGRSVRNDVTWVSLNLERQPAREITIRYEYRAGLVRLGILPRSYPQPDVLGRRERAKGFEGGYCPEP